MPIQTSLRLFVSSTCYELVDLRADLAEYLDEQGIIVRLSDNPTSEFYLDPTVDSIQNCLINVENSDVVVCIIDRRYGPLLGGKYGDYSATEAEVRTARERKIPVFFFVREKAVAELQSLKANPTSRTFWVEPGDPAKESDGGKALLKRRQSFVDFFNYSSKLGPEGWSNWYDQFRTVLDLKKLVYGRLLAHFPDRVGVRAGSLERAVRLSFHESARSGWDIAGTLTNLGPGPAFYLRHGLVVAGKESGVDGNDVLAQGEPCKRQFKIPMTREPDAIIFCEYENAGAEAFRIEVPYRNQAPQMQAGFVRSGPIAFYIARVGSDKGDWVKLR